MHYICARSVDAERAATRSRDLSEARAASKSVAVYADPKMGLSLGRETLAVDVDGPHGLRWQLDWYADRGLVPTTPDLAKVVDNTFALPPTRRPTEGIK